MYTPNIEQKIGYCIEQISEVAKVLPGVVIIHDINNGKVRWMSEIGLKLLGATLEEICALSSEAYYAKFFNSEDIDYVPKIISLIERNNDEDFCTFFQQVRFSQNGDWKWHMSSTKIFLRNDDGIPILTITMAFPIDAMHHMTLKASRLLEENNFLRKNAQNFANLSLREREVLKLMALGKSSIDTAQLLFIAPHTVESHRKNIKQKLNTNSYYELCEYARAFDLI